MKMSRLIILAVLVVACATVVCAGHDKPITVSQLPTKSQQFIKTHFAGKKIALVKKERELIGSTYDVIFTNGDKVEFGRNGDWTEVKCAAGKVPTAIVPKEILQYVRENYSDSHIMQIEQNTLYYEIDLSNRVEIKFNKKFQVVDIDY